MAGSARRLWRTRRSRMSRRDPDGRTLMRRLLAAGGALGRVDRPTETRLHSRRGPGGVSGQAGTGWRPRSSLLAPRNVVGVRSDRATGSPLLLSRLALRYRGAAVWTSPANRPRACSRPKSAIPGIPWRNDTAWCSPIWARPTRSRCFLISRSSKERGPRSSPIETTAAA